MILLNIPKPKNNNHIVWEHVMKTVVSFVGAYALLFFGPMLLGGRRGNGIGKDIVFYLVKHGEVHLLISLLICILYNAYTYIKNSKVNCVVGVQYESGHFDLKLTDRYFRKLHSIRIEAAKLKVEFEKNPDEEGRPKTKGILFRDLSTQRVIGKIVPSHLFWSESLLEVRSCLAEIREIQGQQRTT